MFGFPDAERPSAGEFKKNLLKSVIFQVKFERSEDVVSCFKTKREVLKEKFPITNTITENIAEVRFEKDKTPLIQTANSPNIGYEFKTEDNNKTLAITEDTLSYTVFGPSYKNFFVASSEIEGDFFEILKESNVLKFNRVAIRKINLIEPEDPIPSNKDLLSYVFNKDLINNITAFPELDLMASGISNVTMKKADKRLNVVYGLLAPSQKKANKQILLDIDLFFFDQNCGLDSLIQKWKEINDEIFRIFNWAISKDLISDISSP